MCDTDYGPEMNARLYGHREAVSVTLYCMSQPRDYKVWNQKLVKMNPYVLSLPGKIISLRHIIAIELEYGRLNINIH